MYGNPDELDRIAGEIEKRAESVRGRGTEMNDRARAMQWQSVAADRCRETVEGDRRKLFQAAEGLDGAAAALRRHAQEVREMIAAIKRIAETVTGWFTSAIDTFNRAVDAFNNAVKDIANGVADALGFGGGQPPQPPTPPWSGWKWGRTTCRRTVTRRGSRSATTCAARECRVTPAPHRLVLSAGEFAYLVEKTGVDLPPDWMPAQDVQIGPAEAGLTKKRVVTGVGDEAEVHPSVERKESW